MTVKRGDHQWSRRERQIMEVVWRVGRASVQEVLDAIPEPPSYSAVRTMLRLLDEKGHLRHRQQGRRYVYEPVESPARARRSALQNLLRTFFNDSPEQAVASLIELRREELSAEDLDRLRGLIERVREERSER